MCLFVQHNMRWRQLSFGFSGHRLHNWEISCLRMCVYGSFVCIYHIWICLLKWYEPSHYSTNIIRSFPIKLSDNVDPSLSGWSSNSNVGKRITMYSSQIVFDLFPVPPIPHACMDNVIASMIQSASPQRLDHFIVDVPIPDQDPIGNLQGTRIIIMVRLYFN